MIEDCVFPLNLPFTINFQIPEFPGDVNHLMFDVSTAPKELTDWLDTLNIELEFFEVFKKTPGREYGIGIHIDGLRFDPHAKINFVVGVGKSKMCWWKKTVNSTIKKLDTVIDTPFYNLSLSDATLIAEDAISVPSIVNTGLFHSVENITETRYCFSFRIRHKKTKNRVLWPEVKILFSKYINFNNSHRGLKIPVEFIPPIIDLKGKRAAEVPINKINPEVINWLFDEVCVKIKRIQLFYVPPEQGVYNDCTGLHADSNWEGLCKLNWSFGAPESYMRWYEFKKDVKRPKEVPAYNSELYSNITTGYVVPNKDDIYKVYQSKICNPSLVNVYQPHDIVNYSKTGRYTYSLSLLDPAHDHKINATWNRALKLFKKYIFSY